MFNLFRGYESGGSVKNKTCKFKSGDIVKYIGDDMSLGTCRIRTYEVFEVETVDNGCWLRLKGLWEFPINSDNFIEFKQTEEKNMRASNLYKYVCPNYQEYVRDGDSFRCTGRTTGLAFEYISKAYKNSGQWITVKDHFGTHESDRMLLEQIQFIVGKLDYKFFEFDKTRRMFRLNLWGGSIESDNFVVVDGKKYRLVEV